MVWHLTTCRASARYCSRCDCLASSAPFTNIQTYLLTYLLTSVPGRLLLHSSDANKLLVPRSCTASFGLRSFGSSSPTAWNDMPAHLRNLDLPLSDFRQLLKTALFQIVPVELPRAPL